MRSIWRATFPIALKNSSKDALVLVGRLHKDPEAHAQVRDQDRAPNGSHFGAIRPKRTSCLLVLPRAFRLEMARISVLFASPGKGVGVGDSTTSTHRFAFRWIGVMFPTTRSGVLCSERDDITAPCLCTSTRKLILYRLPDQTTSPVPTPAPPHQGLACPQRGGNVRIVLLRSCPRRAEKLIPATASVMWKTSQRSTASIR